MGLQLWSGQYAESSRITLNVSYEVLIITHREAWNRWLTSVRLVIFPNPPISLWIRRFLCFCSCFFLLKRFCVLGSVKLFFSIWIYSFFDSRIPLYDCKVNTILWIITIFWVLLTGSQLNWSWQSLNTDLKINSFYSSDNQFKCLNWSYLCDFSIACSIKSIQSYTHQPSPQIYYYLFAWYLWEEQDYYCCSVYFMNCIGELLCLNCCLIFLRQTGEFLIQESKTFQERYAI